MSWPWSVVKVHVLVVLVVLDVDGVTDVDTVGVRWGSVEAKLELGC